MNTPIRKRLRRIREMTNFRMRVPKDMVDELKRVAEVLGFLDYEALVRHYINKGLREDRARLDITR